MSTANEKRVKEANECIQKAEEDLKTSIWKLKTKPNYDSAAYEYERAAICFRNAENLEKCRDCYLKASECYGSNNSRFHEAKAKESAAMACKDAKDFDKAAELFEQSATDYLNSGSMDTAAQTIEKAAKMLEQIAPEKAVELYERGIEFVQQLDRSKQAVAFGQKVIALHLKLNNTKKALQFSKDLIEKYELGKIGQVVLGMVLMELKNDDSIAALKMLYYLPEAQISQFSLELSAAKTLIKAYEDYDEVGFQECLKNGVWRSLNNEYLRLIRTIKVPENDIQDSKTSINTSQTKQQITEDDEDEDDLR